MLVLPAKQRIVQPQSAAKLRDEYQNIFASATLCSLPLAAGFDSNKSNTYPFTKSGTVTDGTATAGGLGIKGDGSSGCYSRTISTSTGPIWIACSFVCNSASASIKYVYGLGGASGSDNSFITIRAGDGSSGVINAFFRGNNGGTYIGFTIGTLVVGKLYHCVFVVPSTDGSKAYAYVNGVKSVSGATTLTFSSTFVTERMLADPRIASSYSPDTVLFTGYGKGQINEKFAYDLSLNPWQIFQPDKRAVYFSFGASSQTLTQSATFTDADTFYTPIVTPGEVTLSPSLYSDADTFYTPTVSQNAGAQSLTQDAVFSDADTFYTPAVSVGAVTLLPALFTDADAFYVPEVTQASPQTLTQSAVFENGNIFFEHRFASGAVGKPKLIWAKAKAKIGDVPFEGKQIIKAAKKQAKIDAIYTPEVLEYNDIQIKPPIVSDDEQVKYHAELAYRRAYYAAIQQRIAEYEQDEEDTLLALIL